MKSVVESYPQLWHYTTAAGLHGILSSQQLWATDISYLNDAEEFTGFFERKLQLILKVGVQKGIDEICKTAQGLSHIDSLGGIEKVGGEYVESMWKYLRFTTLRIPVYVTSFCIQTGQNSEDGLLSQWRGYGYDGGYAVVFDTQGLHELFTKEYESYFYNFTHWGDVDYNDDETTPHEEVLEWESTIHKVAAEFVISKFKDNFRQEIFYPFFEPILSLATRHKHAGFREESEVRISFCTTATDELPDDAIEAGDSRLRKPICFRPHNGVLVPYISLFENLDSKTAKLPIKKIIVGPHPGKLKRQMAIEKMLAQLEIEASVVTSNIPYLGR
jgi:hypothetical protein